MDPKADALALASARTTVRLMCGMGSHYAPMLLSTDLEGSLSILGEHGTVEIGGFYCNVMKTWQFADDRPEDATAFNDVLAASEHPVGYGHEQYYRHVVECILTGKQQLVDGLEGRRSLELISAIYESVESGREVPLRFSPKQCRLGRRL